MLKILVKECIFREVAGHQPATLPENGLQYRYFLTDLSKFLFFVNFEF